MMECDDKLRERIQFELEWIEREMNRRIESGYKSIGDLLRQICMRKKIIGVLDVRCEDH